MSAGRTTNLPRHVPAGALRRTIEAVQRFRANFVFGALLVLFALLLARLGKLQLVEASTLRAEADRRHRARHVFKPLRGRILDAHGRVLAASRPVRVVSVDPRPGVIEDVDGFARRVATLLDDDRLEAVVRTRILEERRRETPRGGLVVVPEVEERRLLDRLDALRATGAAERLGLYGLLVEERERRIYPNGTYAAHVLGRAPADPKKGTGTGIEGALHEALEGEAVGASVQRDGRRRLFADARVDYGALVGRDVTITLDVVVQHYLESALDEMDRDWRPSKDAPLESVGIVLDPATGAVVAMASRPCFDPNAACGGINRAIQGTYEPGSAFKPFTVIQALSLGVVTPDQTLAMPESIYFPGVPKAITDTHAIGDGDVVLLLAQSSNTGASQLAWSMGGTGMGRLFDRLDLEHPTGIELPGEAKGYVPDRSFPSWLLPRSGFGQGFAITPIQLASWFCAFAREDGRTVAPSLLPGRGGPRQDLPPLCDRPDLLGVVRRGLADCVDTGTARDTVGGGSYAIAGKTGTAQNPPTEWLNCSFVGYAPRERPRVVVLVMAKARRDEARHTSGAKVAGPAVRKVVDRTLEYWKVAPTTPANPADGAGPSAESR